MKTFRTELSKEDQAIKRLYRELYLFRTALEDDKFCFDWQKDQKIEVVWLIDVLIDQLIRYYDFEE